VDDRRLSLGNYLLLVDDTARLSQEGKATLSRQLTEILDRRGSSADQWRSRLAKSERGHLRGRFFATTRQRPGEVAERQGLKRVPNVGGCPAT
jgi:hypothetical protein